MDTRPVIGHLVSSSELETGARFHVPDERLGTLRAETELGLAIGRRVTPEHHLDYARGSIAGIFVALELVDVGPPRGDVAQVLAANVFRRAFVCGAPIATRSTAGRSATLGINGACAGEGRLLDDYAQTVLDAACLLGALGESLDAGDRLIAGSSVHVPVSAGDDVVSAIDGLGCVGATIET
jgi:2-keto-4-pentenoate hydratase